jgi:hypothetical protein
MILQLHDKLRAPFVVRATRVLATYDDGTPVCLIQEVVPGHMRVFRAGDKDFNDKLRQAGVEQTVIVERIKMDPPPTDNRISLG